MSATHAGPSASDAQTSQCPHPPLSKLLPVKMKRLIGSRRATPPLFFQGSILQMRYGINLTLVVHDVASYNERLRPREECKNLC